MNVHMCRFSLSPAVTMASFEHSTFPSTSLASRATASVASIATADRASSTLTRPSTSLSWRLSTESTTRCFIWCVMQSWLASLSLPTSRRKVTRRWHCTLSRMRRRALDSHLSVATLRFAATPVSVKDRWPSDNDKKCLWCICFFDFYPYFRD